MYKQKWESIRQHQAANAYNRDRAKAKRDGTRAELLERRHASANSTKAQSQQILLQKKEREACERQDNSNRGDFIRQRKEEARRRLEEERLVQLEKSREGYETRIAQEEMLRDRTDSLVAKMEREEMELIQRLQNTQTVQKNAYDELEAALGATSHSAGRASPGAPAARGDG